MKNSTGKIEKLNLQGINYTLGVIMGFLDNIKNVFTKDNEEGSDKSKKMPQKDENTPSEKRNFRYLDDLIHCGKNEIVLDSNIVLDTQEEEKYNDGIPVDIDNIVIDGEHHEIDARDLTRIFNVSANITLKNIIFSNGHARNGGALNIDGRYSVIFKNCIFEGNSSKFYGGAIYNDKGSINFEKCNFKNNHSGNDTREDFERLQKRYENNTGQENLIKSSYSGEGGAVHNSDGSAVFNDCVFEGNAAGSGGVFSNYHDELIIKKCSFKFNNANRADGGVFFNLGNLKIEDSIFEKNTAEYHGGVIFNVKTFEMRNCKFISNTAKQRNGGVLSNNFEEINPSENDNSLFKDCIFKNNMSIGSGGVMDNYKGLLTIENTLFEGNVANSAGAILNGSSIDLTDCVFRNNIAKGYFSEGLGGAICNIKDLNIHNCTLSNNHAEHVGGAIHDEGSLKITDCIFKSNDVSKGEKCAIHNWEGSLKIENSNFNDEIPEILFNKCELKIKRCEFSEDSFITNESIVDILDEEYDMLKKVIRGGNIHVIDFNENAMSFNDLEEMINGESDEITLEKDVILDKGEESLFENGIELNTNNLIIDGNGHYINANAKSSIFKIIGGNIILRNIRFKQAYSSHNGSAIYAENASLTLEKCCFENNNSKWHGGAIYNSNGLLNIDDCRFDGNNSLDDGGAVYLASGQISLKNKCHFINNISKEDGGAIYNLNSSLSVEDCIFENNETAEDGGAIYNVSGSITVNDSQFNSNLAKDGGAIANEGENNINLSNCHFNDDKAIKIGGAILNFGKGISLDNCEFKSCLADFGGCIATLKGTASVHNSCKFKDSISKSKGGAIYNESLNFNIDDSTFNDNKSMDMGGAIYNEGSMILDNCKLCSNSSESEGGAIWSSYNLEVYQSKFDANSSNEQGSSIHHCGNEDSIMKIVASSFTHNRLCDGGAIYILEGSALVESLEFRDFENDEGISIHNESGILEVNKSKFVNLNTSIYNNHIIYLNRKDKIENQVIQGDNAESIRFNDDDMLPEGWVGFDHLNNLIQDASQYLKLDCDITMHESEQKFYEGGIELNRDGMVIDGGGNVIDANNLSRIFYITGHDITLKNIIFKNGKYFKNYLDSKNNGGGAIYALHDSGVNIIDCKFLDNISRRSAGSIVNKGNNMNIESTTFENNNAQVYGGSVLNEGSLKINKCCFDLNSAEIDGGALYNYGGSLNAETCRFNECIANSGGAIDNMKGSLVIDKCEFRKCVAEWDGGAIHNYEGSIKSNSCSFNENNVNNTGKRFISSSLLENDDFKANTSIARIKGFGGAITNYNGSLKLKNIRFENNASESMAHSIYAYGGNTDLEGSIFMGNDKDVILNEGAMTFKNCNFDEIHVITNRSHIKKHYENGNLNIKNEMGRVNTIFEGKTDDYNFFTSLDNLIHSGLKKIILDSNYILSDDEIDKYETGILIDVDNLVIDGNGRVIDGNGKSNIFTIMGKNVTLKNITFLNSFSNFNAAINNGGSLNVENCLFMNNSSNREYGGAIYNAGRLNLNECRFKNNCAIKRAGAVYNEKGKIDIKKCYFEDNISAEKGNAVFNYHGFLTMNKTKFIKNGTETSESAIYNNGTGLITGIDE